MILFTWVLISRKKGCQSEIWKFGENGNDESENDKPFYKEKNEHSSGAISMTPIA